MRIACLQFAPQVGDVDNNLSRADAILEKADLKNLDLLVLPELAFSGYNFKSLNHISPFLEHAGTGISSLWARTTALKHDCFVTVGYPEAVDITENWPADPEYYNSAITFSPDGEQIVNYRKAFLYYTDETWALEGPDGFYDGVIPGLGNVAMGICMDINPYRFQAPWHAWEFANHVLYKTANLVILSMAWLTVADGRLPSNNKDPEEPDMETLAYWLSRLEPIIRSEQEGEIIVVFANRCGREDEALYAGTSAVLGIEGGEVKVYGILGSGESELLIIDTSEEPKAKLVTEPSSTPADYGTHNWGSSSSTTSTPEENEYPASIDAILSASKSISPVEPRFPHAYYAPESLKTVDILQKLNSTAHPDDAPLKPASSTPNNVNQSKQSSAQSTIASSVQSSIPPSIHSSMPSSDHSSITSSLPLINRPNSGKSRTSSRTGTPQMSEPAPDTTSRSAIPISLVIPVATVGLSPGSEDGAEPTSASSMTTNTPWDKDINPFRNEEKSSSRRPSPAIQDPSPFISALQQAGKPQSRRSRTSTPKSQTKVRQEQEYQKPDITPLGFYQKPEIGPVIVTLGASRHPTADPAFRKPPARGLFPPDDRNSELRPQSTGW